MKKILPVVPVLLLVGLSACQKEINWGVNNGGGSTAGTLLVKEVQRSGSDLDSIMYTYDAAFRVTRQTIVGTSQGADVGNDLHIIRNVSGIITSTVQKNNNLISAGIDSVVTVFYYNSGASQYTSTVETLGISGFSITDSTVFVYNASGNITSSVVYEAIPGLSSYTISAKSDYAYTGSDITSIQQSSYDATTSSYTLGATLTYTFTTAGINPIILGKEGIPLNLAGSVGPDLPTRQVYVDVSDASNNFIDDLTYVYNNNNMPATAVDTHTPAATATVTFYYQ